MRVIWCLGMYASASTWLFNVVRQIAVNDDQVFTYFVSGPLDEAAFGRIGLHIVKSHEINDASASGWLAKRANKIFVTIRDPRDAIASLILYHGYAFERALAHVDQAARLCVQFATDGRSVFWPYESAFFERAESVRTIAAHLGLQVTDSQRDEIFSSMRRDAVEAYIAKLPTLRGVLQDHASGDMLDPQTHWHTHHAGRSGEIGRWKQALTADQVAAVAAKLKGCFSFED